jgi:hypothetical protein
MRVIVPIPFALLVVLAAFFVAVWRIASPCTMRGLIWLARQYLSMPIRRGVGR